MYCDNYRNLLSTLWKNQKFTLTEKIFRQINYLVISLANALVSRNFCQKCVRDNFCNFHTVLSTILKNEKLSLIEKIFRQIKSLNIIKYIASCYFHEMFVKRFQ